MSKFLKWTAFAILLLVPLSAFAAKVGWRHFEEDAKARTICLPGFAVITGTVAADGLNSQIFSTTINSVSAPTSTAGASGSPATFMHPAILTVDLMDSAANADTLTCTSVTITGEDQFGNKVVETLNTLTETAQNTTTVFSKVTKVLGAGCAGAQDAGDVLLVYPSTTIGLTAKIDNYRDVEMACIADASGSANVKCAKADDGTDDDLETNVSASNHTINVGATIFVGSSTTAVGDGDDVCFRVRSSRRSP